ncbi:hypothetical protein SCHPADRAFT_910264 [Schizopora paradoxa]|uniref:F-box domain-containing protein n=1 Tax=Schizopora paradoxa TaxID=27342 RepID=A0A0H2R5C7_9AGAM|nr:hypothetical protein SCHPADRAFT_910264 [Schizopora paradoxa]
MPPRRRKKSSNTKKSRSRKSVSQNTVEGNDEPQPPNLLSLPDELLSKCFEFAFEEDLEDGSFISLRLSHVSRRCRVVALGNATIWTTLLHDSRLHSLDFIRACISRSRNLPFTVVVTFPERDLESAYTYINSVSPADYLAFLKRHVRLERCRRVVVEYDPGLLEEGLQLQDDEWEHFAPGGFLVNVRPECFVIRVPYSHYWGEDNDSDSEAEDRLSPLISGTFLKSAILGSRLEHLTIHAPPKLLEYTDLRFGSLSSLHLSLNYESRVSAAKFLRCFPELQDLNITMNLHSPTSTIPNTKELFSLPSIRNLRFDISVCHDSDRDLDEVQLPWKDCVFPNAVTMDVRLKFQIMTYANGTTQLHRSEWKFRPLVEFIFRNVRPFPSLESLSMSFKIVTYGGISVAERLPTCPNASTLFLLNRLPHLKHLEIRSDLRLSVQTTILDYLQRIKFNFPALQTLKLRGSQLKIYKWVGLVLQILKEQGSWGTFEELVVPPEMALPGASHGVMHGEAISEWIRAKVNPKWN